MLCYALAKDFFFPHNAVGLSFYTNDKGLSEAFSQYGQVVEGDNGLSLCNNIKLPSSSQ